MAMPAFIKYTYMMHYLYKNPVMQWYVTLGVPWAAAKWQDNYENGGVPQTVSRCQET
jgi:hypothetical protein